MITMVSDIEAHTDAVLEGNLNLWDGEKIHSHVSFLFILDGLNINYFMRSLIFFFVIFTFYFFGWVGVSLSKRVNCTTSFWILIQGSFWSSVFWFDIETLNFTNKVFNIVPKLSTMCLVLQYQKLLPVANSSVYSRAL